MSTMDLKVKLVEISGDIEFNTIAFEKKLSNLKDSQDSINSCCHWCLQNRQHHKKIVSSWLNVLKRVKIEHRLTLFYLANDVIQYSKRRNYDFVQSWGTTLQKATTMVRDEKIKNKVLRIFKIWEERGIYGEEFITDLCGLISASPSARKGDETHEFQSSYLIQKIRTCAKLENDTDMKLNYLKEHNPKIQIETDLISSLKDRAHVDDVEKELEDYNKHMDNYINALKLEIKARIHLISLLTQAESQLESDKKDVKVVITAYRTFQTRVKALKKKLDEKMPTLTSPVPSPDINAPSPSSDSDIDLPITTSAPPVVVSTATSPVSADVIFSNPGYYNPVPPPSLDLETSFNQNNNFSSFMGTNMSFNLANANASVFNNNAFATTTVSAQTTTSYSINNSISSLFPTIACPPPPPATVATETTPTTSYQYNPAHAPLLPPPMPPFSKSDDHYGVTTFSDSYSNSSTYGDVNYDTTNTPTFPPPPSLPPTTTTYESYNSDQYQSLEPTLPTYTPNSAPLVNSCPPLEDYNPAEEVETWDPEPGWDQPPPILQDTPESPPMSEKTGFADPVEYHDDNVFGGVQDVDHRMHLPSLSDTIISKDLKVSHRTKDIDHRNLISLTGSPSDIRSIPTTKNNQDFRNIVTQPKSTLDQDYRVPFIESLKLPPPPPPPKALTNESVEPSFNSSFLQTRNSFNMNMDTNTFSTNVNSNTYSLNSFNSNPDGNNFSNNLNTNSDYPHSNLPGISYNSLECSRLNDLLPSKNKFGVTIPRKSGLSPKKFQDNVESIDMDLSDDNENVDQNNSSFDDCFDPPADLFDDVDANNFLDNVNENLDFEDLVVDDLGMESLHSDKNEPVLNQPLPNFANLPNMFSVPPPQLKVPPPNINIQEPQADWIDQNYKNEFGGPNFYNEEYGNNRMEFPNFRGGRGGNMRGNFNNGIGRNNWGNRGIRGGMPQRPGRGGMNYRGFNQRGMNRGQPRGRGFRGRGHEGSRGRGDFRGRGRFQK